METIKIYNLIVLDASGSMQSIYNQALSGVNETIDSIRIAQVEHPELKQYITLASFSAGDKFLNTIYEAQPIEQVKHITKENYPLLGCTALYDAMGDTISELQRIKKHDDRVLVTIITDGYENASRRWSGRSIKSLVEELRQMGWTFTYIGANQDVEEVAGQMGIRNSMSFDASAAGTSSMFAFSNEKRKTFYCKMSDSIKCNDFASSMVEDDDFFSDNDAEK